MLTGEDRFSCNVLTCSSIGNFVHAFLRNQNTFKFLLYFMILNTILLLTIIILSETPSFVTNLTFISTKVLHYTAEMSNINLTRFMLPWICFLKTSNAKLLTHVNILGRWYIQNVDKSAIFLIIWLKYDCRICSLMVNILWSFSRNSFGYEHKT